ncbi:hypothetical protein RQP50_27385 [Paenibacillus sp. chi10]|uniref:Lipoprotein n=1 Tax=Paenibacillus suaedae TaxID=3077233 RepID=A0AAJ2K4J9_9BACL|nr:hypothetical protein [Paenibacillus sp. chi10]MDT8979957.1 hypothetical protein [Paenibacillus sp. chi10]
MKKIALLLLGGMLILTGCGSSAKFSLQDMCIKKQGGEEKICYGMSRIEAERVAGEGFGGPNSFEYDNGLTIKYRDNKVSYVYLAGETQNYYELYPTGIKVGDPIDKFKDYYGDKATHLDKTEKDIIKEIDYIYDVRKGSVLGSNDTLGLDEDANKAHHEEYIRYRALSNLQGNITHLWFGDYIAFRASY